MLPQAKASVVARIARCSLALKRSARLNVETSRWRASLFQPEGRPISAWRASYGHGDRRISRRAVVLWNDVFALAVDAPEADTGGMVEIHAFAEVKAKNIYELEPVSAIVPSSLLAVAERIRSLVLLCLLPQEVTEPFDLDLVRATTLARVYAGSVNAGSAAFPVWKLKDSILSDRQPDHIAGDLEIHFVDRNHPLASLEKGTKFSFREQQLDEYVSCGYLPIELAGYRIAPWKPGRSLPETGCPVLPEGAITRDGELLWVWEFSWTGKAVLRVESGSRAWEFDTPEAPMVAFVHPAVPALCGARD